jgi:dynein heavy chain, axonemal
MLDSYHLLLASLDESETSLLEEHLYELKRTIRPGSKRLNWTSLGIHDYLNKCRAVKPEKYFFSLIKPFLLLF